ncbi:hypothetical protein LCGC14_3071180 [marine sediment metagenome]|uniref:Uncharacterized protein n=1 Tax=marine sediment metagenome TaxID=412755 RepID=A0A0F8WGN8_9ZZZZ
MYRGYVKLWRRLQNSSLWKQEKFTRGQAWVDLIMLANHKPGYIRVRGIKVDIDRGQLAHSELTLAKRWKWSRGKVRRFLKELTSNPVQQIEQQKNNLTSLINIINYDQYQSDGTTDGHQTVHQTDTKRYTKRYTNKNDKNVKNEKKELELPDFINPETWKAFKDHRKKMRLIMTPHAEKLIINKLIKFHKDGVDPNAALNEAIEKSWRSVFAPKKEGLSEADQIRKEHGLL